MYFPTAGIECNPLLPFAAALGISFITSMGGISGAFLLLPFQMSVLGYVNPSVSATNQFFNVLACPAGVVRYYREGRLLRPLTLTVALGTLPGVFLGALIRIYWLPDPLHFKIFAALVLSYVGGKMLLDMLRGKKAGVASPTRAHQHSPLHGASAPNIQAQRTLGQNTLRQTSLGQVDPSQDATCRVLLWNTRELVFSFRGEEFQVSCRKLALLSLVVGLVGGVYGIGGGAIMAPFLVGFFGLPVYAVAGATLFATFLTSVAGVAFYTVLAPMNPGLSIAPDWGLGLLLGLGGMIGMYFGARCQKHVPALALKFLLVAVLLFTAARYLSETL